jgi:hypothetical protein
MQLIKEAIEDEEAED